MQWTYFPHGQPDAPTQFELLLQRLGIDEEQAAQSRAVKIWVRRNASLRYVPEWLLAELHIEPRMFTTGRYA